MKKIVIIGGAGFVGTMLTQKFLSLGYSVIILDLRRSNISHEHLTSTVVDFLKDTIDPKVFEGAYAVVSLLGVPIFGRFTKKYKQLIYDSRIVTTRKIVEAFELCTQKPASFISASAIGFYGDKKGEIVTENSLPGNDFLSQVCADWEKEVYKANSYNIRTVTIRTAHVLGRGGILGVLLKLFKKNMGGYFGTGKQHMPWIDIEDLIDIYTYAVEKNVSASYNAVAQNPTQKEFMKTIGEQSRTLYTWSILPFFGRILYGSFIEALLSDIVVDNKKIKDAGFVFKNTILLDVIKKYI